MTTHRAPFRLSIREQVGHGVEEERVWATRQQGMNPGRLKHDDYVKGFRFLVAYEHDCSGGDCQVWTEAFTDGEKARRFLQAKAEQGTHATLFSILPADMAESE